MKICRAGKRTEEGTTNSSHNQRREGMEGRENPE